MIRKAFIMKIYKEYHDEYKRRHDELWPEMEEELKAHGMISYTIFLHEETSELFAYLEIESENKWTQMAATEINQKWWAYMQPLMETNSDNSPKTMDLTEVFHLP